jgi:hypothetical protein
MKKGPDASVLPKTSPGVKICKRDLTPTVPPKTSPGAQNIKTGSQALGTAENEFGNEKHENGTRRPQYRRKYVLEQKT